MKVAIITEGYQGTGYGHLTRCLSIYQAFEEKGIQPLYIANCDEEGKKFIPNVNLLQIDWIEQGEQLINTIADFNIAVIDSYLAPKDLYERIYKTVKKAVYIDDYLRIDYPPGIIVNGTVGAENLPYKKDIMHEYLLGIDYMPLRKEFWDIVINDQKNAENEIKNVLITFGGQDIKKMTEQMIKFLNEHFPKYKVHAVIGNNRKLDIASCKNINLYNNLTADEMKNLMLKCDVAISSASQTVYELFKSHVYIIAIGVADNQKNNITGLIREGIINRAFWYDDIDLYDKIKNELNNYKKFKNKINYTKEKFNGARKIIKNLIGG